MIELNKKYIVNVFEFIKYFPKNYVDLIIADPPSGANLVNKNWDKSLSFEEYANLIGLFGIECYRVIKNTGSFYISQWTGEKNPIHIDAVKMYLYKNTSFIFKEMIVWKKQRGNGNRKGWLQTSEFLLWYIKDNKKFIWNKENQYSNKKRAYTISNGKNLSEYKRHTNVWDIKEIGFGTCPKNYKKEREKFGMCATPKPPEYFERIIKAHTKINDIVFIPFSGSGVAEEICKKLNRNFISCDLNYDK
jgi:DNA modification methylase